jgi:anti-repressor protein
MRFFLIVNLPNVQIKEDVMNLQVLNQKEVLGKQFVIYGDMEQPLFLAKDVAEWIDYDLSSVNKLVNQVDDDEKVRKNVPTPGGNQEMWLLTEDGLYEVLMQSRKPIAKQFKKKVKEILKDIRQHGAYMTDATIEKVLSDPDTIIKIATQLKEERAKRQLMEAKMEEQKPKVIFADAVSASRTSILVGEFAKILKQNGVDIGQNRLFIWLRENGYLIKRNGNDYNMPTQYSMDLALFEIKETSIVHSDGHTTINKTSKITGKGQVYFVNKFKLQLVG